MDGLKALKQWVFQDPNPKEEDELNRRLRWSGAWMSKKQNPHRSTEEWDQVMRETCLGLVARQVLNRLLGEDRTKAGAPSNLGKIGSQKDHESFKVIMKWFVKIEQETIARGAASHAYQDWSEAWADCEKMLKGSWRPAFEYWKGTSDNLEHVKSMKASLGHISLWLQRDSVDEDEKDAFMWAARDLVTFVEELAQYVARFTKLAEGANTLSELALPKLEEEELAVIKEAEAARAGRQNIGGLAF